jgi:hypothetical protein
MNEKVTREQIIKEVVDAEMIRTGFIDDSDGSNHIYDLIHDVAKRQFKTEQMLSDLEQEAYDDAFTDYYEKIEQELHNDTIDYLRENYNSYGDFLDNQNNIYFIIYYQSDINFGLSTLN